MANRAERRLNAWFASPAGVRVLREETAPLTELLRRAHGDTLLWLGCSDVMDEALQGSMVRRRLYGSATCSRPVTDVGVLQCSPAVLPLPNNSLDALVLHHALETAEDPRGVLREAARVVAPGGRLIVCMFNPLSLWGLRRSFARFVPDPFRGLHLLTTFRLLDWLALLGFEAQGSFTYLQYGLPFYRECSPQDDNVLQRFLKRRRVPVGGVCVLSAMKQAAAVRPHWRPAAALAPAAYGKPAYGSNVIRLQLPRSRLPAGE